MSRERRRYVVAGLAFAAAIFGTIGSLSSGAVVIVMWVFVGICLFAGLALSAAALGERRD